VKFELRFESTVWKAERKSEMWQKFLSASNSSTFEDYNRSFKPTLSSLSFFDFFNQNKKGITPESYVAD
jgi:hypothetical protein